MQNDDEKHFYEFFRENFKRNFYSTRTLLVFLAAAVLFILKIDWNSFLISLHPPWIWLILAIALYVDAFITAIGMHFYVRSNRYKKIQERSALEKTTNDQSV